MTRRIVTIVVAVLLAAAGAVGVLDYVHQADNRAIAGLRSVTAYVATKQIPSGTSVGLAARTGLLVAERFPASSVSDEAVRSITTSMSGLLLTSGLAPGQMLLSPMLATGTATVTALPIPPNEVAITLQFCAPQAVANYVAAGSVVDVFNTFVSGKLVTGACSGIAATTQPQARLVLTNVLVLAVGEGTATLPSSGTATAAAAGSSTSSAQQGGSTILLTMAVTQVQAEELIELGESGAPYLALVTNQSGSKTDFSFGP